MGVLWPEAAGPVAPWPEAVGPVVPLPQEEAAAHQDEPSPREVAAAHQDEHAPSPQEEAAHQGES